MATVSAESVKSKARRMMFFYAEYLERILVQCEDCAACGHFVGEHAADSRGDPDVGVAPEDYYCFGSDDCACTGAAFFPLIARLRAELEEAVRVISNAVECPDCLGQGCGICGDHLPPMRSFLARKEDP